MRDFDDASWPERPWRHSPWPVTPADQAPRTPDVAVTMPHNVRVYMIRDRSPDMSSAQTTGPVLWRVDERGVRYRARHRDRRPIRARRGRERHDTRPAPDRSLVVPSLLAGVCWRCAARVVRADFPVTGATRPGISEKTFDRRLKVVIERGHTVRPDDLQGGFYSIIAGPWAGTGENGSGVGDHQAPSPPPSATVNAAPAGDSLIAEALRHARLKKCSGRDKIDR